MAAKARIASSKPFPLDYGTPPKPFTVEYGCAKLGISVPTFYELVNTGKLRTYIVGSRGRRVSDEAIADCRRLLESEAAAKLRRADIADTQTHLATLLAGAR